MSLEDSLETLHLCGELELDFIHVSCWDIQTTGNLNGADIHYTTAFRQNCPAHLPLITTGGVWDADDAVMAMEQGGDFVGVGRAAIAHPNWPIHLQDGADPPARPPFSAEHLASAGLNPTFVQYMRRWDGFVEP